MAVDEAPHQHRIAVGQRLHRRQRAQLLHLFLFALAQLLELRVFAGPDGTAQVVAVKRLRPGEGVGYGSRYTADSPRTIAVIPAGYADGLDTRMSGRAHVLVRGRRVPIVGAVSMDMITVDVTGMDDLQPGDEVVILGRQGEESWQRIDARELGAAVGMIPWEVVCRLGSRIERHYERASGEGKGARG